MHSVAPASARVVQGVMRGRRRKQEAIGTRRDRTEARNRAGGGRPELDFRRCSGGR